MAERKPFKLGFSPAAYNRAGLRAIAQDDPQALQREYARLRRDAMDRLRGFERSSELRNKSFVKENKAKFITLKEVKSQAQLETLIIDAARFVTARSSSVSGYKGIRRDKVNSLRAAGYTWINEKNIEDFGHYMEWAREHGQARIYGSKTTASLYEAVESGEVSSEELKEYFDEFQELQAKDKPLEVEAAQEEREKKTRKRTRKKTGKRKTQKRRKYRSKG